MVLQTDTILITPEILGLVARIDEFKGAWRALGTLAPARLSALRRVATIESIGSSTRIEGSRLTDREVERLLRETDLTIEAIAEQTGFAYSHYLQAAFKSVYGQTPGEFRRANSF